MTPDDWLLEQFDMHTQVRANHVRPIIQLIDDVFETSCEDAPFMSGPARWPAPFSGDDLDFRDKQQPCIPARTAVTFAPAVG